MCIRDRRLPGGRRPGPGHSAVRTDPHRLPTNPRPGPPGHPDHPDTLTSANNLAYAYQAGGDLGRAIPLYEQTLTDTRRILGPDHVTVAVVLFRLAGIQLALGDATAAVRCIQRAIGIDQNAYGDDHPEIATDLVRGPRRSRAGRWGFCGRPHEPTQGT